MMFRTRNVWLTSIAILAVLAGVYIWKANPAGYLNGGPVTTPFADDMVVLLEPLPGAQISSPLVVRGRARGTWFFEASFPITLTDAQGRVISQSYVQAKGDWMTTEFVDFEGTLVFTKPSSQDGGFLVLQKDNPSGLPQYDDSRRIPVYFQ